MVWYRGLVIDGNVGNLDMVQLGKSENTLSSSSSSSNSWNVLGVIDWWCLKFLLVFLSLLKSFWLRGCRTCRIDFSKSGLSFLWSAALQFICFLFEPFPSTTKPNMSTTAKYCIYAVVLRVKLKAEIWIKYWQTKPNQNQYITKTTWNDAFSNTI